ncbi:MAG: NusG domain II-containing protein [Lachnospiraceae bacterium]|nr:NusG domain II-containing protein [Lachnospiraceae bacterium]
MTDDKAGVKKNDLILAAVLLTFALALWLFMRSAGVEGAEAVVYTDGVETARFLLSDPAEVLLSGASGGSNLLVIEDGCACIREADCPDHTCIRAGHILRSGESIICLPHRIVVTIEKGEASGVDAIAE